jgi:four helix bundle protein
LLEDTGIGGELPAVGGRRSTVPAAVGGGRRRRMDDADMTAAEYGGAMPKSARRKIESYRDLEVWQLGMDVVVEVYRVTRAFPAEEKFGLTAQVRRAAVAIASNVAEGHDRLGAAEYRRFVSIARGSVAEVETQLAVAARLGFVPDNEIVSLLSQLKRLSQMLFNLYRSLSP